MASNPPGECCKTGFFRTGNPQGSVKEVFGLASYVVGEEFNSDRVLVIITDIFGKDIHNTQLVADELSKNGKYQVYVPEIFGGDPYLIDDSRDLMEWVGGKLPLIGPLIKEYLTKLNAELKPKFIGGVGYCFGAKFVVPQMAKDGFFSAGAIAHPSFVSEEELGAIVKPLLISACYTDKIFTTELRAKSEEILNKLSEDIDLDWRLNLFPKVVHGFAVRGDISNRDVRYAMESTIKDQLEWFARY
ncbi:uncharacterized protein KQ657_002516 [Scheffersomyces spartinae]|uniref:Dienelactone hydrolase domain-containing protein n=1 Tax=Scheffersomyces spartinae TaxID=45513 RepID=A0A9P7V6N1_9ASCO|nr:uncharacterized protein KQ657_002516 [Scheffersomyces spartinae]KAG7192151.1 hypothetical protein KQ657_002516 [Scheffersomyces spartinae]